MRDQSHSRLTPRPRRPTVDWVHRNKTVQTSDHRGGPALRSPIERGPWLRLPFLSELLAPCGCHMAGVSAFGAGLATEQEAAGTLPRPSQTGHSVSDWWRILERIHGPPIGVAPARTGWLGRDPRPSKHLRGQALRSRAAATLVLDRRTRNGAVGAQDAAVPPDWFHPVTTRLQSWMYWQGQSAWSLSRSTCTRDR